MSIDAKPTLKHYRFIITVVTMALFLMMGACQQENPPKTQRPVKETLPVSPTKKTSLSSTTTTPTLKPKPTGNPTATPEPVSPLGVDPADLRGVNVQFWHTWSGEVKDVLDDLVKKFNASNQHRIRVEATYQGYYDEMSEKVSTALNTGNYPHLVVGYNYQALTWASARDILVDLDDYANDPVWGFTEEELADFYPVFWEQDVIGSKRVGIPAQRSAHFLYYNLTWAEDLGFTSPPTTPAQFKRQACAAAQANQQDDNPDNDATGGWIISTNYSAVLPWMIAFGGEVAVSNEEGYKFDTPDVENALTFLRDLYDDGCAWLAESQYPTSEFATRQGLFISDSLAGIPYQTMAFEEAGNDDEWTLLPYPSSTGDPVIDVYGPSFVMLESSPEEELAAWLFAKWITSAENQAALIQVSGLYPIRASTLDYLEIKNAVHPQFAASLELIPYARPEPGYQSWRTVRWAVSDAATQLFRYYFTIDQVPSLVELLNQTAEELHANNQ